VGRVREVSMKIITYNVRGLGGGEKRAEVRRLVNEKSHWCCVFKRLRWN
jgi:hypothetical protein